MHQAATTEGQEADVVTDYILKVTLLIPIEFCSWKMDIGNEEAFASYTSYFFNLLYLEITGSGFRRMC